jgi:hypothetical protein
MVSVEGEMVFYDTAAASGWLAERGIRRSPAYLRKLRCVGGGPAFRMFNKRPVYDENALAEWVAERLSPRFHSTAQRDAAQAAAAGDAP